MTTNSTLLLMALATIASVTSYAVFKQNSSVQTNTATGIDIDLNISDLHLKINQFHEWTLLHNKKYSKPEFTMRFKVWSDNYDIVQEHNAKNLSWSTLR